MQQTVAVESVLEGASALGWPSQSGGAAIPAMTTTPNSDADRLISFGQIVLEQGWCDRELDCRAFLVR